MGKKFNINKPSKFCKRVLKEADQDKFFYEILILKNSYAARSVFAHLQYDMHPFHSHGDDGLYWDGLEEAYRQALSSISSEVAHRCDGMGGLSYGFLRLKKALEVPATKDEYGDMRIRTIDGWWNI